MSRFHEGSLQFIAIERSDSGNLFCDTVMQLGEWAIPGGMVDPGEDVSATLKREFTEEALDNITDEKLDALWKTGVEIYRGYVDDPRNTDNAWMETVVVNFHDDKDILKDAKFKVS